MMLNFLDFTNLRCPLTHPLVTVITEYVSYILINAVTENSVNAYLAASLARGRGSELWNGVAQGLTGFIV